MPVRYLVYHPREVGKLRRHKVIISPKDNSVLVITDDPERFVQLGTVRSAGRYADVHPEFINGSIKWVVVKDGIVMGIFGSQEEARLFELQC